MSRRYRVIHLMLAVAVLAGLAGCANTAARTAHSSYSDAMIADDVNSRLTSDTTLQAGNVGVTSQSGVVYLTGTVPSSDRLTRATELAYGARGVRSVLNNMVVAVPAAPIPVAVVPPPAPVVVPAPAAVPAPVVVAPPVNVLTSHPRIDISGMVASYDPQNGVVTFQDGRMVRLMPDSVVSGAAGTAPLQPGAYAQLHSVQPLAYQQPAATTVSTVWRMGTVSYVDTSNNLIFLTDGTAIRVAPGTALRSGNQMVPLASIAPGSQIAVSVPTTSAAPQAPPTTVYSGSALPRQTVIPQDTTEVRIFVVPR